MRHVRYATKPLPMRAASGMTCPDCVDLKRTLGKQGNDPAELCIRKGFCSF